MVKINIRPGPAGVPADGHQQWGHQQEIHRHSEQQGDRVTLAVVFHADRLNQCGGVLLEDAHGIKHRRTDLHA